MGLRPAPTVRRRDAIAPYDGPRGKYAAWELPGGAACREGTVVRPGMKSGCTLTNCATERYRGVTMTSDARSHGFGGVWTERKLQALAGYLPAYTTALKDKPTAQNPFRKAFIDAFAGTGYRDARREEADASQSRLVLPDLAEEAPQELLEGSATIALRTEPPFDSYIFIERDPARCAALERLKEEFPDRAEAIHVRQGDANEEIQELCEKDWSSHRAVLFLDPYGMQVDWKTIEVDRCHEGDRPLALVPARHRRQPIADSIGGHSGVLAPSARPAPRHQRLVR